MGAGVLPGGIDRFAMPRLTGRAIRVPHRRVNPGPQRTATVNLADPISWRSLARPARTHPANMPVQDEATGSRSALAAARGPQLPAQPSVLAWCSQLTRVHFLPG